MDLSSVVLVKSHCMYNNSTEKLRDVVNGRHECLLPEWLELLKISLFLNSIQESVNLLLENHCVVLKRFYTEHQVHIAVDCHWNAQLICQGQPNILKCLCVSQVDTIRTLFICINDLTVRWGDHWDLRKDARWGGCNPLQPNGLCQVGLHIEEVVL
jgi:hypothetical protein